MTPSFLDAHITSLGVDLTVAKETAVRDEITRWDDDGIGTDFGKLVANAANYGLEDNTEDPKIDVRRNIAILLELSFYITSLGARYATMQIST